MENNNSFPEKTEHKFDGIIFSSKFDSGNLWKVIQIDPTTVL